MLKKRFCIILIILFSILIFLETSNALTVAINSPADQAINITSRAMNFTCTVSGSEELSNLTLYVNDTSFPIQEKVNDSAVDIGSSYGFYIENIPNGNYQWNCTAKDINNNEYVSSNYLYSVSLYIDYINMPDMTWLEDTVNNSLNLSQYFTHSALFGMTYSYSGNSNVDVSITTDNIVTLTPSANWTGTETITFTATESALTNSTSVLLNITPVNDPPYLKEEFENISWEKNTEKELDLDTYFADIENDLLNYSVSGLNHINATIDNSTGKLTLTPENNWTGTETATITASDSESTASATAALTVTSSQSNAAPSIDTYSPLESRLTINLGTTGTFSITKSDLDNDPLTVKWYIDDSLIQDAVSDSYIFIADSASIYQLKVEVSDGTYTTQHTWTLTVENQTLFGAGLNESSGSDTKAVCGNGKIDTGENCENCPNDVKCRQGEKCIDSKCTLEEKPNIKLILLVISGLIVVIGGISTLLYFLQKRKSEINFNFEKTAESSKPVETSINLKKSEEPPAEIADYYGSLNATKQTTTESNKISSKAHTRSVKLVLLKNYIKDCLRKKEDPSKIRKRLIGIGWKKEQVDSILNEFNFKK